MRAINTYWNMHGGYDFVFIEITTREKRHFASYRPESSRPESRIIADKAPYKTPYQKFTGQRRWTDILLFLLLGMELALKLSAATTLKPYTYSRKKLTQATGFKSNLFWGAATLATGFANLFITQPLMFLGNVCNHVRCVADGILNFIASPFTAAIQIYQQNKIKKTTPPSNKPTSAEVAKAGEIANPSNTAVNISQNKAENPSPPPSHPINAWAVKTGEIMLSSFKGALRGIKNLAIDAVTGAICYGISYVTGGAAAPILIPAATALQTASLSAATSAAVAIAAAITSALAGFSNIISTGIHGCLSRCRSIFRESSSYIEDYSSTAQAGDAQGAEPPPTTVGILMAYAQDEKVNNQPVSENPVQRAGSQGEEVNSPQADGIMPKRPTTEARGRVSSSCQATLFSRLIAYSPRQSQDRLQSNQRQSPRP